MRSGGFRPLRARQRHRNCRRGGLRCMGTHRTRPGPTRVGFSPLILGFRVSLSAREPPKPSDDGQKSEPMSHGGVGPLSELLRPRNCRRGGVRCVGVHRKRPGPLLAGFSSRVLGFQVSLCPKTQRKQPGAVPKSEPVVGGFLETGETTSCLPTQTGLDTAAAPNHQNE